MHIAFDLVHERIDIFEFLLWPEIADEAQLKILAVNVAVEIEQMNLQNAFGFTTAYSWPITQVHYARINSSVQLRLGEINAVWRKLFVVAAEVCCWKTNLLSQIVAQKQQEVAKLCADNDAARLRARALEIRKDVLPFRLRKALEEPAPALKIIAEFKRMSPSRGVIQTGFSPAEAARLYERGGACAISVLTDKEYFGGSINDLIDVRASTRLPILRKDFIMDPIQIYQAAIAGADAVLLIAAYDRPFIGQLAITPEPLLQIMPDAPAAR